MHDHPPYLAVLQEEPGFFAAMAALSDAAMIAQFRG